MFHSLSLCRKYTYQNAVSRVLGRETLHPILTAGGELFQSNQYQSALPGLSNTLWCAPRRKDGLFYQFVRCGGEHSGSVDPPRNNILFRPHLRNKSFYTLSKISTIGFSSNVS